MKIIKEARELAFRIRSRAALNDEWELHIADTLEKLAERIYVLRLTIIIISLAIVTFTGMVIVL